MTTDLEWSDLGTHFGTEPIVVVDRAVCESWPKGLDEESAYLHTEHISYEVLKALYQKGYTITKGN